MVAGCEKDKRKREDDKRPLTVSLFAVQVAASLSWWRHNDFQECRQPGLVDGLVD